MLLLYLSSTNGNRFDLALVSLVFWRVWLRCCGYPWGISHLRFCWNNDCLYHWKVIENTFSNVKIQVTTEVELNRYIVHINFDVFSLFIFRYLALCHPLKTSWHAGKGKTIVIIIGIWILSAILSFGWIPNTSVSILHKC